MRKPVRKESVDERKVSKEWRDLGYHEHKIEVANKKGIPDRYYSCPRLRFHCEWKSEKGKLSPDQELTIKHMRKNGDIVMVATSRTDFWNQYNAMIAAL